MKLRSWKVLGGEGAPGSESLQKKMTGGLWPCSLIPPLDFHKQMRPSRSQPWKPHSASGERKGRGLCQQVSSILHGSPQPCLWRTLCFLPSRFPSSSFSLFCIFFLPLSTQELVTESWWLAPSGAHSSSPGAAPSTSVEFSGSLGAEQRGPLWTN